jgi:hypothetical protein
MSDAPSFRPSADAEKLLNELFSKVPVGAVGLSIRQLAWFRAFVETENVRPFPIEEIDQFILWPLNRFQVRTILGKGPINRKVSPSVQIAFSHGQEEYPVFQHPGIGPVGAGMYARRKPARRIQVNDDEAAFLLEVSSFHIVGKEFREIVKYKEAHNAPGSPSEIVMQLLKQAGYVVEKAIGAYALYQYPLVWEPLGIEPRITLADPVTKKCAFPWRQELDTHIPFRLNPTQKLKGNQIADACITEVVKLADNQKWHLPLLLLQRALWQKSTELRFLESFLLLEHLVGQSDIPDCRKEERQELFRIIESSVVNSNDQTKARVNAIKHIILQAPLKERLSQYLTGLEIQCDPALLGNIMKSRNDLAHGRSVGDQTIKDVARETFVLARLALRKELANQGLDFGSPRKI